MRKDSGSQEAVMTRTDCQDHLIPPQTSVPAVPAAPSHRDMDGARLRKPNVSEG
jgi:hypothetical protein